MNVGYGYGTNWRVEDNRKETPGYKRTKIEQQKESILRILEAMKINPQENRIKIVFEGDLVAASGPGASAASCVDNTASTFGGKTDWRRHGRQYDCPHAGG
ncbi:MAG: hypothetical protein ABIN18_12055 [Pseudomonadota bacterium]